MLLYKYRSLAEWNYALDILVNRRLYAAQFTDLNDPMEGYYSYAAGGNVSSEYNRMIHEAKASWYICSLSKEPYSTLMWSYYSGGHTGIVIGVEIQKGEEYRLEKVTYDNSVYLNGRNAGDPQETAVKILSQKLHSWSHEVEHRVFSRERYVPIGIKKLLLGCKITESNEALLRRMADSLFPDVKLQKLKTTDLIADYGPKKHSR